MARESTTRTVVLSGKVGRSLNRSARKAGLTAANVNSLTDDIFKYDIDFDSDLDPDDRTAFFEELPGEVSQRLVQMLSQEEREVAMRLLGYPEDSIGRLMTPEYVAVRPYFTVAQALEHIRRYGRDSETLDVIYVVD